MNGKKNQKNFEIAKEQTHHCKETRVAQETHQATERHLLTVQTGARRSDARSHGPAISMRRRALGKHLGSLRALQRGKIRQVTVGIAIGLFFFSSTPARSEGYETNVIPAWCFYEKTDDKFISCAGPYVAKYTRENTETKYVGSTIITPESSIIDKHREALLSMFRANRKP